MFGFNGLFIGPLIASLFISIWEVYGVELADLLPDVDAVLDDLGNTGMDVPKPEPRVESPIELPDDLDRGP
jgi:hypothetical protein